MNGWMMVGSAAALALTSGAAGFYAAKVYDLRQSMLADRRRRLDLQMAQIMVMRDEPDRRSVARKCPECGTHFWCSDASDYPQQLCDSCLDHIIEPINFTMNERLPEHELITGLSFCSPREVIMKPREFPIHESGNDACECRSCSNDRITGLKAPSMVLINCEAFSDYEQNPLLLCESCSMPMYPDEPACVICGGPDQSYVSDVGPVASTSLASDECGCSSCRTEPAAA